MPTAEGGLPEPAGPLLRGTGEVREEDPTRRGPVSPRRARPSGPAPPTAARCGGARRVTPGTAEVASGLTFDQVE